MSLGELVFTQISTCISLSEAGFSSKTPTLRFFPCATTLLGVYPSHFAGQFLLPLKPYQIT